MFRIIIKIFIIFIVSLLISFIAKSQTRYAVLPFQNMEGKIELNVWSYKLQDSLQKALMKLDPENKYIQIVPADSIEDALAEINLDPTSPEYLTDMWKSVQSLNVEKVITGDFYVRAGNLLINAYVYNVRTKLAYPKYQAKNIFKKEKDGLKAINIIVKRLKPFLIPE